MTSVYVKTLGCKVNTFDSHALENQFQARGFALVDSPESARVTVINTCSVTANAEREARYLLRRFRRENPDSLMVVTGCYAQVNSAALVDLPEVDLVIPNERKEDLVGLISDRLDDACATNHWQGKLPTGVREVRENRQTHFKSSATLFASPQSTQTRAFLKVQDGCNNFCTYCLIPYARGASRSVDPHRVLEEVRMTLASGSQELVLTGIHIGDYGADLDTEGSVRTLTDLLARILEQPRVNRLRISSLEPSEVSEDLLNLMAANPTNFCDHFHLPLQSGSNDVLRRMRRTYDCAGYADAVARIRRRFPNACIGADVIPGFPGETEDHFAETIAFIQQLPIDYLHVFPYSKRPNTAAARMPSHVAGDVIKARAAQLRQLSDELLTAYYSRQIGRTVRVLWEKDQDDDGRQLGHSMNYLNVAAPRSSQCQAGAETWVRIKGMIGKHRVLGQPMLEH